MAPIFIAIDWLFYAVIALFLHDAWRRLNMRRGITLSLTILLGLAGYATVALYLIVPGFLGLLHVKWDVIPPAGAEATHENRIERLVPHVGPFEYCPNISG